MRRGSAVLAVAIVVALVALSNHNRTNRATLPDLRGLTLSDAQARARAEGFHRIESQDATHEDRTPFLTNNWRVCSQLPGPGTHAVTTLVAVTVVRRGERCP
ncbi:PASTA domain-containing protein [Streptomyces sp. NPDC001002]